MAGVRILARLSMGSQAPNIPDFVYHTQGTEMKATCKLCGQEMAAAKTTLHKKMCPKRPVGA